MAAAMAQSYLHPQRMEIWSDYFDQQAVILSELTVILQSHPPPYGRRPWFGTSWDGLKPGTLEHHKKSVEEAVEKMVNVIKKREPPFLHSYEESYEERDEEPAVSGHFQIGNGPATMFDIGDGVLFKRHVNVLAENGREVFKQRANPHIMQLNPFPIPPPERPNDQNLRKAYRLRETTLPVNDNPNNPGDLLYLYDMWDIGKMPTHEVRLGLKALQLALDADELPRYHPAEVLLPYVNLLQTVVEAVNRMYQFMIEAGLSFGYITNGAAFVFLNIQWNKPTVLRYRIIEPLDIMAHQPAANIFFCQPAVQVLSFIFLSLTEKLVDQDERHKALRQLQHQPALAQLFQNRKIPNDSDVDVMAVAPFLEPEMHANISLNPFYRFEDMMRAENTDGGARPPRIQFPNRRHHRLLRRWCTPACLLSLKLGGLMDKKCPNLAAHKGSQQIAEQDDQELHEIHQIRDDFSHRVDYQTFFQKMVKQFESTMNEEGLHRLNIQGDQGIYFQLTELSHGYVFMARGGTKEFITDFNHESLAYAHLQDMQGNGIPVYLGQINFCYPPFNGRPYYADHRTYLHHFTFFSWAGRALFRIDRPLRYTPKFPFRILEARYAGILEEIHKRNLSHGNITKYQVLWDRYTGIFALCNFTRSIWGKKPDIFLTDEEKAANVQCGVPYSEQDYLAGGVMQIDWQRLHSALKHSTREEEDDLTGTGLLVEVGVPQEVEEEPARTLDPATAQTAARKRKGKEVDKGDQPVTQRADKGKGKEVDRGDHSGDQIVDQGKEKEVDRHHEPAIQKVDKGKGKAIDNGDEDMGHTNSPGVIKGDISTIDWSTIWDEAEELR